MELREMLQYLCRLCARTDKSCVNVFSNYGDKHLIQKKIRLCLPVIVGEEDEMPRQICLSCLIKLESTYEFYTTCISAQSAIQRLLKAESLHERDHVNKSGSEKIERIPTSFSLDQYLKRKIDPVDTGKSSKVPRTDKLEKDLRNGDARVESTKSSDSEASTSGANSNSSVVATNDSGFQCVSTAGGNNNSSVVATNNSEVLCAKSAEPQKPKLRVRTTSELRQAGLTGIVTDCVSTRLSLQDSSSQSVSVPTTRQSTCVSASLSTSVAFPQCGVPQSAHSASSLPQHVKSSSVSKGSTSQSPVVQIAKSVSSVVQSGKNSSSAPQRMGSSPTVLRFGTSSSSVLQTATSSLPVSQNATALLPVPKEATVSLPVPNNSTVSLPVPENATASLTVANNPTVTLSVPQNVSNSSSVQQYSLSVPSSLSSGCTILPNVSQFIIVPDTFASAPTFTAAGTSTVAVLTSAVPSNLVGDMSIPLGQATTLVAPQSTQTPAPISVEQLNGSTEAVPLAPSSLPLAQTVPLQLGQQLPNPVMTSLTSVPAIVSQSSTSNSVTYSVLNRNSQALVIPSNSHVAVTTSTANVFSKADCQPSTLSQNLKVSSGSSISSASSAPAKRISAERKIVRLRSDIVVQGAGNAATTVLSKQNGSAQLSKNFVAVSNPVSRTTILQKPTTTASTDAKNITSNSTPLLLSRVTFSTPNTKKSSSVKLGKASSSAESTPKRKVLLDRVTHVSRSRNSDSNRGLQKTASCHSDQLATKVNCLPPDKTLMAPTSVSLSEATVVTSAQPMFSVGPLQQSKEGTRCIIVKKTYSKSAGNKQLPVVGAVSNVKTESQLSENRPQQKAAVLRPKPPGGLPPPPLAVPLNSLNISENRRILPKTDATDLQNGEATSMSGHQVSRDTKNVEVPQKSSISNQAKSGLIPKPRVTATVSPFVPTLQPASEPQRQSPVDPSPEVQVEPVRPSSQSPPTAGPGRPSSSPPPAAVGKEECPHCHIEFPADILIHHKTLHYREKFYTCIDCDKNFVTEKGLESHRCQKESKG